MKAVQLIAPENLVWCDLPSRRLGDYEIRVQVDATAICGSDLKNFVNPVVVPQVPGHEFAGHVLEVGSRSLGTFAEGDRITAFPMMSCMSCTVCDAGDFRDCEAKKSLGFQIPGSFAQEVIVDGRLAVTLIDTLSYEQGALVEHLACGYRLTLEIARTLKIARDSPSLDAAIVIIGDGPIALADLQNLGIFGFTNVTVLGKHASRMNRATRLGAARVLSNWEIGQSAVDVCVYAAPAETALESVLTDMPPGGFIFAQTAIRSPKMVEKVEKSGVASKRAFAYFLTDFAEVMQLMVSEKLRTADLITTRLSLIDIPQMMHSFLAKNEHFKILISND